MKEKKVEQKYIDKALAVQGRILRQVKMVPEDDILLFVCAAYNAELALNYQKMDELNK